MNRNQIHFDSFSGNWDCDQWIDRPNWLLYWLFGGWAIWIDSGFDKQTFLLYGCVCVCVNNTGAISFYQLTLRVWHSLQCPGGIIWILDKLRNSAWIFCMCACVLTIFVEFHLINWRLCQLKHTPSVTLTPILRWGLVTTPRANWWETSLPPQTHHYYPDDNDHYHHHHKRHYP